MDNSKLAGRLPSPNKKQIQEALQAQKEMQELSFKQDCRRTAIQMAERFSKSHTGEKEDDPLRIISNAEVIYQWMINLQNDAMSKQLMNFQQTGELVFKNK